MRAWRIYWFVSQVLVGVAFGAELTAPDDADEIELEPLVVEAKDPVRAPTSQSDLAARALRLKSANTLGKTLQHELGVHNLSYGPGVGQPVIRGMSGGRVRVMHDGIGAHDASAISPDHPTAAETLLADRIIIQRGPASLRYGSGAVGGVIDVHHQRIPDQLPERPVMGRAEYRFDHNPSESAGVIALDAGTAPLALHLDYFQRGAGNLRIPGWALDDAAIREQFRVNPETNSRGVVLNSDSASQGGSAGASWIDSAGHAGLAYYEMSKDYGVPPGVPGHQHIGQAASAEAVRIAMRQRRYDFETRWDDALPWFDSAAFKASHIDYQHDELDRGRLFTRFAQRVTETRLELGHHRGAGMTGFFGVQWQDRQLVALGVETYVPPVQTDALGVFLTETLALADTLDLELGARYERQLTMPKTRTVRIAGLATPLPLPGQLRHDPLSFAIALDYEGLPDTTLSVTWQHAQRAPDAHELLSSGPHLATRAFEIGGSTLRNERANHFELGVRYAANPFSVQGNVYIKTVDRFIYAQNLGYFFNMAPNPPRFQLDCANVRNCLPVYGYRGDDAWFWGYETAWRWQPVWSWGSPYVMLFSDYVRGRFSDAARGDVPRLPPLRAGVEWGVTRGHWQGALRYTHALAQNRPGLLETVTPAYDRLDLEVSYEWPFDEGRQFLLFSKASNMNDAVIRNATSFLRSFAPEAGFSFEMGFSLQF